MNQEKYNFVYLSFLKKKKVKNILLYDGNKADNSHRNDRFHIL